jgi:ECF sigma factor
MSDSASPSNDVAQLLVSWSEGDAKALEALTPLVYDELRRLAGRYLRRERPDHTLQSTALVHEGYLRMVDQKTGALAESRAFLWSGCTDHSSYPGGPC